MELEEAEIVEGIAMRYHVLPSVVLEAPATLLRHVAILQEAGHFDGG